MSTKLLVPLCAAALLTACGPRDVPKSDSEPATGAAGDAATGVPGETTNTPGGTAGETTAPPGTSTPPSEAPPMETPPGESPGETPPTDTQQPTSPSSSGGE